MSLGAVSGRLRRSFRVGCFVRVDGWWTYELCPFKHARQFRTDGSPPAGPHSTFLSYQISSQFALGAYDADGDEWLRDDKSGAWLYVQRYTGGTDGREATVRFLCADAAASPSSSSPPPQAASAAQPAASASSATAPPPHVLSSVSERSVHRYVLEVHTPLACHTKYRKRAAGQQLAHQLSQQALATPSPSSSSASAAAAPSTATKAPSSPPPSFPGASVDLRRVLELLHGLQEDCLHFFAQYWTYRLCYLDGLHQFHRETTQPSNAAANAAAHHSISPSSVAAGSSHAASPLSGSAPPLGPTVVTVLEFDLGRFLPSSSPSSASSQSARSSSTLPPELTPELIVQGTELVQGVSWEDTYARQLLTQGTPCGLPNLVHKQRKTELRFVCDQATAHTAAGHSPPAPSILSLSEVATCEYLAVVSVPALCRHPSFSPKLPTVHEIHCVEVQPNGRDRRRKAREQRRLSIQQALEEDDAALASDHHSSEQQQSDAGD